MAMPVEMTEEIPPAAATAEEADDITLYGVQLVAGPPIRALLYGFCFQGHCYRLAIPATFQFKAAAGIAAVGCGYDGIANYISWIIEKEDKMVRIERRKGTAEELILDFNLPGRSPATLTYSAKVQIATKAGKVYE